MKRASSLIVRLLAVGAVTLSFSAVGIVRDSAAAEQTNRSPAKHSDPVELLFVQNSVSGSFDGKTLTLTGVGPTIFFSDRPYRIAGQVHTSEFIGHWDRGSDNFQENPPNATLSIFGQEGIDSAVVELTGPNLKGHTLSYQVKVLEGRLPATFKESSLFIDIFGRWAMFAAGTAAGRAEGAAMAAAYHPPVVVTPAPVYTAPVAMPEPAPVNVTVTTPAATAAAPAASTTASGLTGSQSAAVARLKELKSLLSQGLISQSQYDEESQKLLNEIVQ